MKDHPKSLSVKIREYEKLGYNVPFRLTNGKLNSGNKKYEPKDVKIIEELRFEGESDPGDLSILFVLETNDGAKGLITDAFGPDGDAELHEFLYKANH